VTDRNPSRSAFIQHSGQKNTWPLLKYSSACSSCDPGEEDGMPHQWLISQSRSTLRFIVGAKRDKVVSQEPCCDYQIPAKILPCFTYQYFAPVSIGLDDSLLLSERLFDKTLVQMASTD
jgi:hypothetical protein